MSAFVCVDLGAAPKSAMDPASRPKSKHPDPRPVGLQLGSQGGGGGSGSASGAATPKQPPEKKFQPWHKTRRGKRDHLRAVAHYQSQSQKMFKELHKDPDTLTRKLYDHEYPSRKFHHGADQGLLARYCNYLLQGILQLLQVFEVGEIVSNTYGVGYRSSARMSLLFMRSVHMENASAQRLLTVKRHMYARMLVEQESADAISRVKDAEWKSDRIAGLQKRVHDWVLAVAPKKIGDGEWPKSNLSYDLEKQWGDVWKVA